MIGLLSFVLVAIGVGCKDAQPPTGPTDNDSFQKSQLVGIWVRESDKDPVIYEKTFKDDGAVVIKEFRKTGDAPPARGVEVRFHRYFKNLPLVEETHGTWDIRGGLIYYRLKMSNGTEMSQQYRVERLAASEFVQSSQGIDGKIEESYMRGKAWQAARPSPTSRPATRKK
jgi:hypothetical protein